MAGITDKMLGQKDTEFEKIYDKIMPILFIVTMIICWVAFSLGIYVLMMKN